MTDRKPYGFVEDPKSFLTWMQIGALLVTMIWVFAFMRADVNRNRDDIERHESQIQTQIRKQTANDIEHAVTEEQYRQIMEKLEEINDKLDN